MQPYEAKSTRETLQSCGAAAQSRLCGEIEKPSKQPGKLAALAEEIYYLFTRSG